MQGIKRILRHRLARRIGGAQKRGLTDKPRVKSVSRSPASSLGKSDPLGMIGFTNPETLPYDGLENSEGPMSVIEDYLAARAAFIKADNAARDYGQTLSSVGTRILNNPATFGFTNTQTGLPTEAFSGAHVDALHWKNAEQIQELLANYHACRAACAAAWGAVPADMQEGLQQPPAAVSTITRRVGGTGYR